MRRRIGTLLALLGLLSLLTLSTGTANAASGTYLRLAHLSPDTPTVDITLIAFSGDTLHLDGVSYGDVSTYRTITPGDYTVQMRLAGAPASPPILTGTLRAEEGHAYTAAALGTRSDTSVRLLTDDLSLPSPGRARVRVVQGTQAAGAVTVTWNGDVMAGSVAFGTATGYVSVPPGHGEFGLAPTGGAPVMLPVDLAAGRVYTVIVTQKGGRLTGQVQTDAVGSGSTPAGGVETGMGGTADPGTSVWWPTAVGGVAALVLVLGFGLRRAARR